METMTYTEILTTMCAYFDATISPRKLSRTNTNIIYLILKAIAKGYEVINSVCVVLDNKFDPEYCSDADLESTASLVGTDREAGAYSGLLITATNSDISEATILAGTYSYKLDDDTTFSFTRDTDTVIEAGSYKQFIALSDTIGSYSVTEQKSVDVSGVDVTESTLVLPDNVTFSCSDNSDILGYEEETDLAFRTRLASTTDRQDTINELQTKIKNQTYIFDCKIVFNNTEDSVAYGDYTIPSYYMLIMVSGDMKDAIADIVAQYGVYPTVETDDSTELFYKNDVFASGSYSVFVNEFVYYEYTINMAYALDTTYNTQARAESTMLSGLYTSLNTNEHSDTVTEKDVYDAIDDLNVIGVTLLSVSLLVDRVAVDYISIDKTKISKLTGVTFTEVE